MSGFASDAQGNPKAERAGEQQVSPSGAGSALHIPKRCQPGGSGVGVGGGMGGEAAHLVVHPFGSLGRWVMCQTLLSASCLESQSGSAPFPRAAMHRAEVRGLSGEHRHCCSAGAGIQGGLWASAGTCEAEHSRLTPDFLSTVQLGGEGSCSISHTCLAFLDVTAINK